VYASGWSPTSSATITSPYCRAARSLAIDAEHPIARRIAGQAHPDLLVLERTENDNGVLRTVITVERLGGVGPWAG